MRSDITFQGLTFPTNQIKTLQAAQTASLDMRRMEVDTVELTVKTGTEIYGLITSDGYPLFTSDGYRLCASESFALEQWSQANPVKLLRGGSQYALWYPRQLKQLAGDFYAISGTSPLGKLTQMEHRGGIYDGVEAGGLIREICGDVDVYVSGVFEHVLLYGYLPYVSPSGLPSAVKGSAKDNLLKVLFALNASLHVDASGTIRIENLNTEISSVIDSGRVYRENAAVVDDVPITSVTVLEHQYIEGTENKTLFEGTTTAGQIVIFRNPCSDLVATGFSIVSSGANWAELSAGTGTLTGTPYTHITREVTRTVSESDTENAVRIEDATLVGITNSGDVADRMADYYSHRKRITCDATVEFERPGDVVSLWDSVAKIMRQACIEKISPLNLSGTMKAKLSALVGFTPWQTVPFEDVRVVITSGSSYTFPADILQNTNVTAVLIGGGDGGEKGGDGEDGGGYSAQYVTPGDGKTYTVYHEEGQGGQPGTPGAKGAGGKILRINIKADPGETVACAIGQGGAANGGVGGNTQFAGYTSADGVTTDDGWVEPIFGHVYGKSGDDGLGAAAGGDGAHTSYSAAEMVGKSGNDYGDYVGGEGGTAAYLNGYTLYYLAAGGGGSGATASANGANSPNASFVYPNDSYTVETTGAPGISPPAKPAKSATNYGFGGDGGDAGSGGGGSGAFLMTLHDWRTEEPALINVNCSGAPGGTGGDGSAGVQGAIILYFRKPIS